MEIVQKNLRIQSGVIFFSLLIAITGPIGFSQTTTLPPQGVQFHGTNYSAYAGTDKLWDLTAVKVVGSGNSAKAYNVHGVLYHKKTVRYTLKSSMAIIDLKTSDILFPDSATFENPKGERIWTRVLQWDSKVKKFLGSKGVKVSQGNTVVQGDKMVLDRTFEKVRIKGHVHSESTHD